MGLLKHSEIEMVKNLVTLMDLPKRRGFDLVMWTEKLTAKLRMMVTPMEKYLDFQKD